MRANLWLGAASRPSGPPSAYEVGSSSALDTESRDLKGGRSTRLAECAWTVAFGHLKCVGGVKIYKAPSESTRTDGLLPGKMGYIMVSKEAQTRISWDSSKLWFVVLSIMFWYVLQNVGLCRDLWSFYSLRHCKRFPQRPTPASKENSIHSGESAGRVTTELAWLQ